MSNPDMSLRTSAIVSFSTLSRSKSRRLQNSECLCIEICLKKYFTTSIAPIILMLVLFICVPALNAGTVGIMVPVGVIFTVAVARIMYKKGLL